MGHEQILCNNALMPLQLATVAEVVDRNPGVARTDSADIGLQAAIAEKVAEIVVATVTEGATEVTYRRCAEEQRAGDSLNRCSGSCSRTP